MSRYELFRVVFPTPEFADHERLFVNKRNSLIEMDSGLVDAREYRFNTWMNVFAARKFYHYCDLGNLYLRLDIEGDYIIKITGSNRNAAFDRIDMVLAKERLSNAAEVLIPDARNYDGVYFAIFSVKPIKINSISWVTDKPSLRSNKMAVVTCTFKREQYINKTISIFEDFIHCNPDLKEKIKLYVIDNGKTLDATRSNDITTIIPNINAGGAGGFTRGLMEVMKGDAGFTRVLFMDDDVEIFAESFFRIFTFSNYLKEEYKDSSLNGAMLDLYNKNMFFENLAKRHAFWTIRYIEDLDVRRYNNVLKINDIKDSLFIHPGQGWYAAWWFYCFAIERVHSKGLSLPLFIRGDDVEWGWRHDDGKQIVSLNGICVWHAPFEHRVSKVMDNYYLPRNMFIVNSIHMKDFKENFKKYFDGIFRHLIKTYDYNSIEILLMAMADILKGSEVLRENPEAQFKRINDIYKKLEYLPAEESELNNAKKYKRRFGILKKIAYRLTKRGLYYPKFFMKKQSVAVEWNPHVNNFKLARAIKVYNLLTSKYTVRKFDKQLTKQYTEYFYDRLDRIYENYDNLCMDYKKSHKELTSFEFWKKYLHLHDSD